MTLPLPVYDGTNAQVIFDLIAQSAIDTGGRSLKFRVGSDTLTFTASDNSALKVVSHGLGSTPVAVVGFPSGDSWATNIASSSPDATHVSFRGGRIDGSAVTTSVTFYWVAFG